MATALNPHIGYDLATTIVQEATRSGRTLREVAREQGVSDEILDKAVTFIEKAKGDDKPFFCWLNPTRMHVVTHLSEKYEKTRTPQNGWSIHEAGMAQLDDMVGSVMKKLADMGMVEKAKERLREIVEKFPGTKAADEAKEVLAKLPKK